MHKSHAAADVYPHCVGNDRFRTGHYPSYRHAVARMCIRHQCNVPEGKGQVSQVFCLAKAVLVEVCRTGQPHLNRQELFSFIKQDEHCHLLSKHSRLARVSPRSRAICRPCLMPWETCRGWCASELTITVTS